MQYELETTRNLDSQQQAAQRRAVAEAEQVASAMPSAPCLVWILRCLDWRGLRAVSVRRGLA